MATSDTATATIGPQAASTVPWYLWCAALAVTSAYVGGYWDISWHRSIGRDSFWTPPHVAIYACGVLAGLSSAYLILTSTFDRRAPLRDASVRLWGLRAPMGAYVSAWGGVAMLASAPFDDWWHNAYGLDVKIISPPHIVLAAGFFGIEAGTVLLMLAFMNRAAGAGAAASHARRRLEWLFIYVGGTCVAESLLLKLEYINRSQMHSAFFYLIVAIGTPGLIAALGIAANRRWACTAIAGVYTLFGLALLWILPLVPAEPKLGPVLRQVTHLIPWEFPLLVIVPAAALDIVLDRTRGWRAILRAPVAGATFLAVFLAVQWPFADFLMTPAARNWFFGTAYFDYGTRAASAYAQYRYYGIEPAALFRRGLMFATAAVTISMWIGLRVGLAMRRVRR